MAKATALGSRVLGEGTAHDLHALLADVKGPHRYKLAKFVRY